MAKIYELHIPHKFRFPRAVIQGRDERRKADAGGWMRDAGFRKGLASRVSGLDTRRAGGRRSDKLAELELGAPGAGGAFGQCLENQRPSGLVGLCRVFEFKKVPARSNPQSNL